jgi:hypothetical protein
VSGAGSEIRRPAVRSEGNVRILQAVTRLDIPVERILAEAGDADLTLCIVVGEEQDGSLYFASNKASDPRCFGRWSGRSWRC